MLSESPQALQLRYLQTLQMISTDRSSTIVFPIPMDILPDAMHMSRKWNKMNAILDYTFTNTNHDFLLEGKQEGSSND